VKQMPYEDLQTLQEGHKDEMNEIKRQTRLAEVKSRMKRR